MENLEKTYFFLDYCNETEQEFTCEGREISLEKKKISIETQSIGVPAAAVDCLDVVDRQSMLFKEKKITTREVVQWNIKIMKKLDRFLIVQLFFSTSRSLKI